MNGISANLPYEEVTDPAIANPKIVAGIYKSPIFTKTLFTM